MKIPIIDIFAGPGGLGEGFSNVPSRNRRSFDIKLSIEKDANAHKTLELRSFFRNFSPKKVPSEYYDLMRESDLSKRESLKEELFKKYPKQARIAKKEALQAELGHENFPPEWIDKKIRKALNGHQNWVLIGGPPCQAYSLVGRSRRQWKENLDKTDTRVHLYKEYLRIIAAHHPAVFVMENVKGLLSSKVDDKKIFDLIKSDLQNPTTVFPESKAPKYKVYSLVATPSSFDKKGNPNYKRDMDYLIKSEDFGVPQKRHRVILLGVREDIDVTPETLTPGSNKVTLSEVIGDLPKVRSGLNRSFLHSEMIEKVLDDGSKQKKKKRHYENLVDSDKHWKEIVEEFREEIISWNGFAKDYSTNEITTPENGVGSEFVHGSPNGSKNPLAEWYYDPNIKGVANHQSRSHLTQDLKRYMFSSMYAKTYKRFPRLHEFEKHSAELIPDHENVDSGKFADRFRVQLPKEPATTVTSHISKDGHYFIHYDPDQCRSLTVREAARIQTFPDNYLFCGSRTAQYHQVGNAVPPYLAKQIGEIVKTIFKSIKS